MAFLAEDGGCASLFRPTFLKRAGHDFAYHCPARFTFTGPD
jgi:hypothetical protein